MSDVGAGGAVIPSPWSIGKVDFEAEATTAFNKITSIARQQLDVNFSIDMSVSSGARDLLRQKLREAGFSTVEFHHDQREGNYITLSGNPYARGNATAEAERYVNQINALLQNAQMYDKSVIVDINVPISVQGLVKQAFVNAGWANVTFHSDQRDGNSVRLITY